MLEGTEGRDRWDNSEEGQSDYLYAVALHADQEARGQLGPGSASVEESG